MIIDTGHSYMAILPDGSIVEDVGVPEVISAIYKHRDQFESTRYTGEESMSKSAIHEYFELVSNVNKFAEELVNMIPRLGNLTNSNKIDEQLRAMSPDAVIPELGVCAGRVVELQRGWSAMFVALNTPVEITPGVYATPIEIIYRRDTPDWVSKYSLDTAGLPSDNPSEVTD